MTKAIAALVLFVVAAPGPAQDAAPAAKATGKRPWTVLVYGAADNNADGPILGFLDGVRKAVDDDPGLDLLLFIDRSKRYAKGSKLLGGAFTGARLYRLHKASAERLAGGSQLPELTLDADPELNSADAGTLGRFIAWGKSVSPAERYALLVYSHANGRTMCPDEDGGDGKRHDMGIPELTDKIGPEGHVDFLALELCNMGGIEIAYQWRPQAGRFSADVLLAIPNAGPPLDWARAFARIRTEGHLSNAQRPPLEPRAMTAPEFGALVIEEGYAGRKAAGARGQDTRHEAAASYDLGAAGAVKEAVDALAAALAGPDSKAAFLSLRAPAPDGSGSGAARPLMTYEGGGVTGPYVDLYDLCERAAACEALSPEARGAAAAAKERVDAFVLDSFGMPGYAGFERGKHGVFIVFPRGGTWAAVRQWYRPDEGGGSDYGRWSFLRDGERPPGGPVGTWHQLLESWMGGPTAEPQSPGASPTR